jgi:L-alanine-DL-glutamate epimerase-like enolase superfamily enzyme
VKIVELETIALVDPGKATETLVRVRTDEGIEGIGQAEAPSRVIEALLQCEGGLQETVRGEDPLQVERLWQKMYSATALFGRRGVALAAIGAVETALWDIAGKIQQRPVCELIWRAMGAASLDDVEVQVRRGNGAEAPVGAAAIKRRVVPYATVYPPGDGRAEMRRRFRRAADRGFRAVKLERWPGGLCARDAAHDAAVARCVRDAIGEERELMIDVANAWADVNRAAESIRAMASARLYFVEAPLPPDNLDAHARLAREVDTRIAAGDWGFTTRFEFEELMTRGGVDVVQPSTVRSGGIGEIVKIAEAAYRRGLLCIPHAWCHGVGVAAAIHLAAVLPNMPYIEYPMAFPDSPLISDLLVPHPAPDAQGTIEVPGAPGLGVTLNEKVVQRFRVKPR